MSAVDHIKGQTFHGRQGAIENAFRYSVDYLLLDPETATGPRLFSRNQRNLTALFDRDHGGAPGQGRAVAWVREVLAAHQLTSANGQILLLAQPRVLGHVFNPVSFWLCYDNDQGLRAVIAEVSNTYGERHSYLCAHADQRVITRSDVIHAQKIFHVSPFQPLDGVYTFRFDIAADRVGIWIDFRAGPERLFATLTGKRALLTNTAILRAAIARPFGSRRVLGLIHWQALKLWWKGAPWHVPPEPPCDEISK